jgi:hypothetical protein
MLAYVPVQNTLPLPVTVQDVLLINASRKFHKIDSFASRKQFPLTYIDCCGTRVNVLII